MIAIEFALILLGIGVVLTLMFLWWAIPDLICGDVGFFKRYAKDIVSCMFKYYTPFAIITFIMYCLGNC